MTASYPSFVWNGDTDNRDMSLAQRKAGRQRAHQGY